MSSAKLPNSLPSKIWYCKIGEVPEEVLHREWPTGADSPMRDAVSEAFRQITGEPPMFIFSGWAAELTEYERAVVENREPDPEVIRADLQRELAILPSAEQSEDLATETEIEDAMVAYGSATEYPCSRQGIRMALEVTMRNRKKQALQPTPIPMWLKCPYCFATHIDRDEWATRPHKTHLCEYCGIEWRPAEVYTVGIEPWDKALNP